MWEKHEEERINKIERKARSGNTLGIIGTIGTGLAVLGNNVLGGIIGGGRNFEQAEINRLAGKESDDYLDLTKAWYEGRIEALNDKYAVRQVDIAEKFSLYQNDNNNVKALQAQIDDLKTKVAIGEAVRPYQDKILMDAIAREAAERCCADQRIVSYGNQTYAALYTASQAPGATTVTYTQKPIYNPLCCNPCGGPMMGAM
jgi:ABC-type glutathione transport system ATPase component